MGHSGSAGVTARTGGTGGRCLPSSRALVTRFWGLRHGSPYSSGRRGRCEVAGRVVGQNPGTHFLGRWASLGEARGSSGRGPCVVPTPLSLAAWYPGTAQPGRLVPSTGDVTRCPCCLACGETVLRSGQLVVGESRKAEGHGLVCGRGRSRVVAWGEGVGWEPDVTGPLPCGCPAGTDADVPSGR